MPIAYGLVRHLERGEPRVDTIAKNTPIQGLAAIIFRLATVLAHRAMAPLGGRIVLLNHDALLYEAPEEMLSAVAAVTERAMQQAFARLLGDRVMIAVETDLASTSAWCKDGHGNSFDRFMGDPTYRIGKL